MDGTPTDCVNIAVAVVLKGLPDLVVSGINKGWNLGDDVTYSGTVSGALEGALLGVPSIAVSLKRTREGMDFSDAARGRRARGRARPRGRSAAPDVPEHQRAASRDARLQGDACRRSAPTSRRSAERVDPKHRPYYWIDEAQDEWEPHERSDYQAVRDGYISVTPLQPGSDRPWRADGRGAAAGGRRDGPVAAAAGGHAARRDEEELGEVEAGAVR